MWYNLLICPLTILYGNLWHPSMFYSSYKTFYDFPRNFFNVNRKPNYTVFRPWKILYDPCMISRKSHMILVWLPRVHTNHVWPSMIAKNHIWPSMTINNFVWWANRDNVRLYLAWHFYQPSHLALNYCHEIEKKMF